MSKYARDKRIIYRGWENPATIDERNMKANRRFDRWLNGLVVIKEIQPNGYVWWRKVPNSGLIHKGRKQ